MRVEKQSKVCFKVDWMSAAGAQSGGLRLVVRNSQQLSTHQPYTFNLRPQVALPIRNDLCQRAGLNKRKIRSYS